MKHLLVLENASLDTLPSKRRAAGFFTAPARNGWLRCSASAFFVPGGKQMRHWIEVNRSTLVLARGELAALPLEGRACRISCVAGRLWVTATGHREDFVLSRGEQAEFMGPGRIVVEALRTATIRLEIDMPARVKARALLPPAAVAGRA
jgi:hypothetical protein